MMDFWEVVGLMALTWLVSFWWIIGDDTSKPAHWEYAFAVCESNEGPKSLTIQGFAAGELKVECNNGAIFIAERLEVQNAWQQ